MQIEGVRLLGWREWPETAAGRSAKTARGLDLPRKAAGRR